MNIHLKAFIRLIKLMTVPTLIGVSVAIAIELLSAQQLIFLIVSGTLIGLLIMIYRWILEEIRNEEKLVLMKEKYDSQKTN